MLSSSTLLTCLVLVICSVDVQSQVDTDYDLYLTRLNANTSNPDIVDPTLRAVRIEIGTYGVNGTIVVGTDIDDTYSGSLQLYRSPPGSSQVQKSAYEIEKTNFYNFMTKFYVGLLQEDFKNCTNFPQHANQFDSPLPMGTYYFNKCVITKRGLPGHFQPGSYRASVAITGENLELWISGYFEVYPIV